MARKRKPGSQSAGYHYDATPKHPAPTKTPTVAPSPSQAARGPAGDYTGAGKDYEAAVTALPPAAQAVTEAATQKATAARSANHAERRAAARQERLVSKFVTKAYEHKVSTIKGTTGGPVWEVGKQVEKAKSEVDNLRERLLSHPAVKDANAEGKVVPPKGLEKLREREAQYHAIKGPQGISTSKEFGIVPRSLQVGKEGAKELATTELGGKVARYQNLAKVKQTEKGAPSTIEALSIASLGVPGIGIGGSVAKLSELGARAIPAIASREAATQLASKGAVRAGAAIAERGAATKAAVKGIPQVLKSSPQLAKAGLKGAPKAAEEALRAAPKTVPKAVGRGALRTGQTTYHAGSGLGVLAATQNAGIDTPPGKIADAILKGTSAAVSKHPGETLETTGRAIPSAVTAPAALLYATGQIPFEGTGPLEKTASMQFEGLKQIGGDVLSGDPKRVQKAVQAEGALAFLTPLPALTRSKAYKTVRTDMREAASGIRRLSGKGRQAPKGVEQSVFGITDRKAARKRVALTHSRTTNPHRIAEARHEKAVLHGSTRHPALEKVPEDWGHTISTLFEAGIRGPEGVKLMRERGPKTEPHAEGKINLDAALKIAEANPQMFQSKPFLRALRAGERASKTTPAALAGMGEVARYRTQGDLFGITPPDRAVPHAARRYTSAKDREGAWKQLDQMEGRLTELRTKARVKGPKGKAAPRRSAELKALETRTKGLRKALDPYTRPSQKTASGERKFWDERLEKEYIAKVQAKQKDSPLVEPAWTHHATFSSAKAGMEPGALPGRAGGKVYVRRGKLAENDLVDRSLEAFVRGTIQMPRRRAAGADFARQFVRQEKHPFTLNGKAQEIVPDSETWARITGPKTKQNPDGGQFDPNTYARFPIREWKTAVEDPFTTASDLNGLLAEAEAGRVASHEPSVIVPRESIKEFRSIANPEHSPVTEFANKLSRTSSRLILGTNPTWVIAQIPAEGIPMALAHPELLNPLKTGSILKELHSFRKQNPEQAAVIEGAAGASPEITAGSLRSPLDLEKGGSFNPQPAMFAEAAKQMTRGKWGRAMISTAKLEPLGLFDVKRQNAYRSVLLAAEADKQFRSWTSGVRGMFRTSAKLSEKFRGKSREELWTWLSTTKEGKAHLDRLANYVDNVQGNWTAFSRFERSFAPFVIFYPFLRYSLRWTLWTFPRTHPLAATIAYTLGQVNSNELEKVLGAKPASPFLWAQPVVSDAEGKRSVLPGGSRIAVGQAVPQQAIAGGKPSQLMGVLNPILGAGLTAFGGPGPFGDKPSGPAGWAAVDQLLSLPAPLRLADVHSEKLAAMLGLTRPQPQSVISKAFEKLDENKKMRQGLMPWLPQSAADARMSNELSAALSEASANSKAHREDVAGDDSLSVQDRQKKIKQMEARSDKAKAKIDGVLKKLHLDTEDAEAYERYKAALYEGDKEAGGYSTKGYETGGYESSGYGGPKSSKALQYKPPGAGSISIPGLDLGGALGAVAGPLASLVTGEKASAATPPKQQQSRDALGKKTVGAPTGQELIAAGKAGTLKINHEGKITTPKVRKTHKELETARRIYDSKTVPKIEGIENSDQREFAEWLSHYSKIPPKLAGEWAKQEGGGWGSDGVSGGEAGEQNWLGVGYPGEQTAMSQSHYFNNTTPKKAAKATAEWLEGKIGGEYDYHAADSIIGISRLAKGGASEDQIRAYIEGPSAWGTGEIAQSGVVARGGRGAPAQVKTRLRQAEKKAKALGLDPQQAERPTNRLRKRKGPLAGSRRFVSEIVGQPVWGDKELGHSASGDHQPVSAGGSPAAYAQDINQPTNKAKEGEPAYNQQTLDKIVTNLRREGAGVPDLVLGDPSAGNWEGNVNGYRVQLLTNEGGEVSHIHFGARWTGEKPPPGTEFGEASLSGSAPAPSGSTVGGGVSLPGLSASAPVPGEARKSKGEARTGPAERLKLVNEITSGNFEGLGIPGFQPSVGPSVADLQRLGASLEEDRRKLARL